MYKVAVVIGGSNNAFAESELARELLSHLPRDKIGLFIINDMIAHYPYAVDYCVTLHPQKLPAWLGERERKGYPKAPVWAHRQYLGVQHWTEDWGGSSGLFSVKIARELKFEKIILCGVPMDVESQHFIRGVNWNASHSFRRGWEMRKATVAPYVRSYAGWTRQLFGPPSAEFLTEAPRIYRTPQTASAAPGVA